MLTPQRLDFTFTPSHGRATRADACFIQNSHPKPIVIFIHGFKGFKELGYFNLLADYFAQASFAFVKLNLSHNGSTLTEDDVLDLEAFGRNNFSLELTDIKSLIDLLTSGQSPLPAKEIDPEKIFLIGHSRGGGLAILVSAQESSIKATATWAAISNLDQRWSEETLQKWQKEGVLYVDNARTKKQMPLYYQLIEDYRANKDKLNIPAAARKMSQPLLLVHGTEDETLPVQMAYDLKKEKPDAQLDIIPEANHTFGGHHPFQESKLPQHAQIAADLTIAFFHKI